MLTKRIIPCLDVKNGRTVKGVNFLNLKDAGDPVELAKKYAQQGADELVFLDISATLEKRKTLANLVLQVAKCIDIPFTVGGGIATVADAKILLEAGADKVAVNSAAIKSPQLISELVKAFGSQCIVLAVDAKYTAANNWFVHSSGGSVNTSMLLDDWLKEGLKRGAGEILFTAMNQDGTQSGFACQKLNELAQWVTVPIIASGGAGCDQDFIDVFESGKADAALAASVFHFNQIQIPELKRVLFNQNISVRL